METYVLGPNAARKLKGLFAGQGKSERRNTGTPGVAFDSEYAAPYTVQWAQSANDGSGAWIIWLPSDSLLDVSGDRIDVSDGLEPAGVDYPEGWFALTDDMIDADAGGVLYLNIRKSGSEGSAEIKAELSSEDGHRQNGSDAASEDKGDVVTSIAICLAEVSASDGSRSVKQFVTSTIVIKEGYAIDKISIDKVTADDADDPSAIQVKDFDNKESDGGQGLAERLEIRRDGAGDSASFRIVAKSNESKVHLVARVNGKIKYIPLSGSDEKDPDEENPPPDREDCSHPGDADNAGGVSPDDDGPGGGLGGWNSGGGVPPGGGFLHPGDDNCNC